MAKIVFDVELPPHSGTYELEIPANFTMREERILKQMAGVVAGEWLSEMDRGSLAAIHATACIAMRRAGKIIDPRTFEDVSADTVYKRLEWVADEDESPLVPESSSEQNGNGTHSSEDGEPSSTPTLASTNPPFTGDPA